MTVNTTTITGFVVLPNDAVREKSSVIFAMTGFDTDADDNATIVPIPIEAPIASDGSIDVDLWPNPDGVRTTFYRVKFSIYNGNRPILVDGGLIEVPVSGGPYDLNDLLPIAPPQGSTVDEYIAQLASSVAAAEDAADAAVAAGSPAQELIDNIRVTRDAFSDLAGVTSSDLAVGDYARIMSIGATYQRAPDAATDVVSSLDFSGSGGLKFYAVPLYAAVRPEHMIEWYGVDSTIGVDNTSIIQSVFDKIGPSVIRFNDVYDHTFNEINEAQDVKGRGRGTGLRQLAGITLRDSGGPTGSYGLSSKSGITYCGVHDLDYDGNYTTTTDYSTDWELGFDPDDSFTVGRYKQTNIAFSGLNRDSWVHPDRVEVHNVYSHKSTRNCFLFSPDENRPDRGVVNCSNLIAQDAAVDHWFYCDRGGVSVHGFLCMGYARDGGIVTSGNMLTDVSILQLTENPNNNPTHSTNWQTEYLVDDRPDTGAGTLMSNVIVRGDLSLINTQSTPFLIRSRVDAGQFNNWSVEHTGGVNDAVYGVVVQGTLGAPGSSQGLQYANWVCSEMPERYQLFVSDVVGSGHNLGGATVAGWRVVYASGCSEQDLALIELNGEKVENCQFSGIVTQANDFGVGGPSRLFDNNATDEFSNNMFTGTRRENSSGNYEAWETVATTTVSRNFVVQDVSESDTPTGSARALAKIRDCEFRDGSSSVDGIATFSGDGSTTSFLIDLDGDYKLTGTPSIANVWSIETDAAVGDSVPAIDTIRLTTTTANRGAIRVAFSSAPPTGTDNIILGFWARI